jgi:CheY-like chemotaxis protein
LEKPGKAMRLLLVEDDQKIATFVKKGFKAEGFAVDHAPDGTSGLDLALTEPYDAAVVDIMLPGLDGLSLIGRMRREKVMTPVIILSAKSSIDDRVRGLQTGGDDYLSKPFAFSELLARVQALIRRASGAKEPTRLTCGDLTIDMLTREVRRGGGKNRSAAAGVLSAGIPDAKRRSGRVQDHDHGARLGLPFRSADQCRGSTDLPAPRQGGQRGQRKTDPYGPRGGVCPSPEWLSCPEPSRSV